MLSLCKCGNVDDEQYCVGDMGDVTDVWTNNDDEDEDDELDEDAVDVEGGDS